MKHLLTLLAIITIVSCAPKHNLEIRLKGFDNETLVLRTMSLDDYIANNYDNMQTDTLVAHNGVIKTNIQTNDSPKYFQIEALQYSILEGDNTLQSLAGIARNFICSEDNIQMEFEALENHIEVKVKRGSQANKEIATINNDYRQLAYEYFALITGMKGQELSREEQNIAFGDSFNAMNKVLEDFINENPDKEASLFLLFSLQLSPNQMVEHLEQLNPALFTQQWEDVNIYYKKVKTQNDVRQKAHKMITENGIAFDFTLNDINGNKFTLSSLRGKWVVLDFWGTWCGPCMRGVPTMKQYYKRYADRMEIAGIACNDKEEQWRKIVTEQEMNWTNVLNPQGVGPEKSLLMNYEVSGFPTKIIITPEGRAHKVFIGETEDFYKEIDKIMK